MRETYNRRPDMFTAIAIEIGNKHREVASHGNLGNVFNSLGEFQKAKEHHEKALAIAIEIGDKGVEATTNGNFGNVFFILGEYQKAKEHYEKALAIKTEVGERKGEEYVNLGNYYFQLRKNRQAKEYLDKAVGVTIAVFEVTFASIMVYSTIIWKSSKIIVHDIEEKVISFK